MSANADRMTVPEIATRLRCSEWFAVRLCRSGRIEATKPAGKWLATPAAVDAYEATTNNQAPTRRRRRRAA